MWNTIGHNIPTLKTLIKLFGNEDLRITNIIKCNNTNIDKKNIINIFSNLEKYLKIFGVSCYKDINGLLPYESYSILIYGVFYPKRFLRKISVIIINAVKKGHEQSHELVKNLVFLTIMCDINGHFRTVFRNCREYFNLELIELMYYFACQRGVIGYVKSWKHVFQLSDNVVYIGNKYTMLDELYWTDTNLIM